MKRRNRHRRYPSIWYSKWTYVVACLSFLLITLCVLALLPDGAGNTVRPENETQPTSATPIPSTPPSPIPYVAIYINRDKLTALTNAGETVSGTPLPPTTSAALQEALKELALAKEAIVAEREALALIHAESQETNSAQREEFNASLKASEASLEKVTQEIKETEKQLKAIQTDITEHAIKLEKHKEDGKKLSEQAQRLSQLKGDITNGKEAIAQERAELEDSIQSILDNPYQSADGKQAALLPLYAALEQLVQREDQMKESERNYFERVEELKIAQESHNATGLELTKTQASLDDKQLSGSTKLEEQQNTKKKLENDIAVLQSKMEQINSGETDFVTEYEEKLSALDAEEQRLLQEEAKLLQQNAAMILDTEESDLDETRILARIVSLLRSLVFYDTGNDLSNILLTDVADIKVITE